MLIEEGKSGVLPLRVLAAQVWISQRAKEIDFEFLKDITTKTNTPE